jgi:hypothetical protein
VNDKNQTIFSKGIKMNSAKFSILSISHLTENDNNLLFKHCQSARFPLKAAKYQTGFFIELCDSQCLPLIKKELIDFGMSTTFLSIVEKAVELGIILLQFDDDGQYYGEFPSFEW